MEKTSTQYDVAVIGGGPAGMIAAGRSGECGAKVVLLEKNATLGKKLLMTGGGRCNLTNAEFDKNILLEKYKKGKKFLFSPFSKFGVQDTIDFFNQRNMPTKTEEEKRVFPTSDQAQSVLDVLEKYMADNNVKVLPNSWVSGFEVEGGQIAGVKLASGEVIHANSYILATGGKSRPETGSTGEGFEWLKQIGHSVVEPDYALVPLKIKEKWVGVLSGLSLRDIKLTVFQNGKKQLSDKGKMLFTHFGVSGPLILNISKDIGELLKNGEVIITLDLKPELDLGALDKQVQEVFVANNNKKLKNSLGHFVAPTLAPILVELSGVDPEKFVHSLSRDERLKITRLLKSLPMTVQKLMDSKRAVVTSGGLRLEEVDFKDMRSRLYPNLFVAGDALDIDRPSGGYSLQLCWTTGFVAGTSASQTRADQ